MAKNTKTITVSVEEKLNALYELQKMMLISFIMTLEECFIIALQVICVWNFLKNMADIYVR